MSQSSSSSGGIGIAGLLGCSFVTLKLCGVIGCVALATSRKGR